jgi:hypothetical protein
MFIAEKLHKTADSLSAHAARGYRHTGQRALELIDRYESLREEASEEVWEAFCKARGYAPSHTAYDFFA